MKDGICFQFILDMNQWYEIGWKYVDNEIKVTFVKLKVSLCCLLGSKWGQSWRPLQWPAPSFVACRGAEDTKGMGNWGYRRQQWLKLNVSDWASQLTALTVLNCMIL